MNQYKVTIMVVDLTGYAKLFDRLDSSIITDLLNQYFQELCTIAIRRGATIDQFMGDGALLIFNIDQNQNAHEAAAVTAAVEMREAFRNLKQRWVTLGYAGTEMLFVRFGLSSGLVARAEVGHAQARRITVIGPAVNAAAHICEAAPRDHDTICITQEFRQSLPGDVNFDARPVTTSTVTLFELSR
jgi:class 3 adenylate cyclase